MIAPRSALQPACFTLCLLALCSCATTATRHVAAPHGIVLRERAAGPAPEARGAIAEAEREFDLGSTAYARGRKLEALEHFQTAVRLAPCAAVLFNLARVSEELRRDDDAVRSYLAYLQSDADANSVSSREALSALSRLAPHVSWVIVRGDPAATVDSARTSSDGTPMAFAPGMRVVQFSTGTRLSLRLRGGDVVVLECAAGVPPVVSPGTIAELHLASIVAQRSAQR